MALEQANWTEWVKDGEENLRSGKAPWSPYYGPITRYMVINRLKQYQKDLNDGKVIVKESENKYWTNHLLQVCYKEGFYIGFMKLLQKSYPEDYEKYGERMGKRIANVLLGMEPFGPV